MKSDYCSIRAKSNLIACIFLLQSSTKILGYPLKFRLNFPSNQSLSKIFKNCDFKPQGSKSPRVQTPWVQNNKGSKLQGSKTQRVHKPKGPKSKGSKTPRVKNQKGPNPKRSKPSKGLKSKGSKTQRIKV